MGFEKTKAERLAVELADLEMRIGEVKDDIMSTRGTEVIACEIIRTGDFVGLVAIEDDGTALVATTKNNRDLRPYGVAIEWIPTGKRGLVLSQGFYDLSRQVVKDKARLGLLDIPEGELEEGDG